MNRPYAMATLTLPSRTRVEHRSCFTHGLSMRWKAFLGCGSWSENPIAMSTLRLRLRRLVRLDKRRRGKGSSLTRGKKRGGGTS